MKGYELTGEQRAIIEGLRLPFAVCQFLEKGVATLAVSDGFCELFGYEDRSQAYTDMSLNMFKDIHPDDTAGFTNALLSFGAEGGRIDVVYRVRKKEVPGYKVIHLLGEHMDAGDEVRLAQIWFTEEGEYKEESGDDLRAEIGRALHEESGNDAARYDYLTGLPNMSYFFELTEIGRKKLLDQGALPALLYIDLCGMKSFNHKYGFSEGDRLLRSLAVLLGRTFSTERCCHVSADRFAVLTDENGLEERLSNLFREWREMRNNMHLPLCVGIYQNRLQEVSVASAFDRAKLACDAIKCTYASSINYYNSAMGDAIVKQRYILENLDSALAENWIQAYYQPILRAINGKVCNEEALARWIDPQKGILPPADFIPYLEDSGLIYKLDLFVLEQVLKHIKDREAEGLYIVPISINLSRADFDVCDMVEEVRSRVDASGVQRDRISIEITESVIGSDFDYMKRQVERFQDLGFPVWIDDFGSGYSSLDLLQSVKFNLLKFDMGFLQRLDENGDGRIILTELTKMASALGVDTICEGVETEEQVRFLQEIGCSRLQGFYFGRPSPIEEVLAYHREHKLTGYENPEESEYYESICGLNLYDIGVIAREEENNLQNAYATLPMCIIEIKGDSTRFARTNQSYRDFFKRFFDLDLSNLGPEFVKYDAAFMSNVVTRCCEQGVRSFYDEKMSDGSIVHSFARRIAVNPLNGIVAVAVAVLSVREPNERLLTEQILAVIEQFGEYMPGGFFIYKADGDEELLYANRAVCDIFGCDDLNEFKALTGYTFRGMVHPDDYERISSSIVDQVKESQGDLDYVQYRIVRKDGEVRWLDDYGHFINYDDDNSLYYVFISDITDKYERSESDKALRSAVIEALTSKYDSVWLINDIETERFELYRIDNELEHLIPAQVAVKIEKFSQALDFYSALVLEEDRQRFLESVAPKSIARNIESKQVYSVPFRRVFDDGVRNYRIDFVRLDLPNGKIGIASGFMNVDEEVG